MPFFQLEGLGLCEHCGVLLSFEGMPTEAIDAEWRCPKCNVVLTHKTFGYEKTKNGWQKVRWVGKDRKWTEKKPTEDFTLGNWKIIVKPIFSVL